MGGTVGGLVPCVSPMFVPTPMSEFLRRTRERSRTGLADAPIRQEDLDLLRVFAICEYFGGALILGLVQLLPNVDSHDFGAYRLLMVIAVTLGCVRIVVRRSSPNYARFSLAAGVLFVAVVVAVSRPVSAIPIFYLWPLLGSAYFLTRRDTVLMCLLFVVSFWIALRIAQGHHVDQITFLSITIVSLAVTLLVRLMREHMNVLVAELGRAASIDALTGLANRGHFTSNLERVVARSRIDDAPVAVVLMDLDHFKAINDRLGHAAGDAALRRFAAHLDAQRRAIDFAARFGGEEFVVVLPGTALEEAVGFADRFRSTLRQVTAHDDAPMTVSAGVAWTAGGSIDSDQLLASADLALYAAKNAGRDRVAFVDGETTQVVPNR
jgi:diguanylate cyclase (GGDEF)-like protein